MGEEEKNTSNSSGSSNSSNSLSSSNGPDGSNTSRIKTILEAIGVEGVFIGIIILIILGILSYLNIIPIGSILQGSKIPFLSNVKNTQELGKGKRDFQEEFKVKTPPMPTAIPGATGDIEVASANPSYNLTLASEEELVKAIEPWGVFGRYYSNQVNGSTTDPLKKIKITLVNSVQPSNQYRIVSASDISTSSKNTFTGDTLVMDVNLSTSFLDSTTYTQDQKNSYLMLQILSSLYKLTHTKQANDDGSFDKNMTKEIVKIMEIGTIFSVDKK